MYKRNTNQYLAKRRATLQRVLQESEFRKRFPTVEFYQGIERKVNKNDKV